MRVLLTTELLAPLGLLAVRVMPPLRRGSPSALACIAARAGRWRSPPRLQRTDGTARLEMFETGVVSDTTAELKARTTGRKVLVPCAAVCVVEPATVLELAAE